MGAKEKLLKRQVLEGFMCDALKYQKLNDAGQDLDLAIRKFMAACDDIGNDLQQELIVAVFLGTDKKVCFDNVL